MRGHLCAENNSPPRITARQKCSARSVPYTIQLTVPPRGGGELIATGEDYVLPGYPCASLSLGPLANGDASRYAALAAELALFSAAIAIIAWIARAGAIVNFISESVIVEFSRGSSFRHACRNDGIQKGYAAFSVSSPLLQLHGHNSSVCRASSTRSTSSGLRPTLPSVT